MQLHYNEDSWPCNGSVAIQTDFIAPSALSSLNQALTEAEEFDRLLNDLDGYTYYNGGTCAVKTNNDISSYECKVHELSSFHQELELAFKAEFYENSIKPLLVQDSKTKPDKKRELSCKVEKLETPSKFMKMDPHSQGIMPLFSKTSAKLRLTNMALVEQSNTPLTENGIIMNKGSVRSKSNSSKYRGVSKCQKDGRWQARIRVNSKVMYLGRFQTELEAAECYDEASYRYHGKDAKPNFIDPHYERYEVTI